MLCFIGILIVMLSVVMVSIVYDACCVYSFTDCYVECRYGKHCLQLVLCFIGILICYAECYYGKHCL